MYLAYATDAGHAFIDRRLYLPRFWVDDPARCRSAGVPDEVGFATKPELARQMITAALDSGAPAGWVAADEVYGQSPGLRSELESRSVGYVLAVACDHRVRTAAGVHRADALAATVPRAAWQRASASPGAKGHRFYDWALIGIDPGQEPGYRHLPARRNRSTGELAYYRCYAPTPVPLATLVRVAGRRWTVEESFYPIRERTHRTGPASGPHLEIMAPLDRAGHAHPRLPRRAHHR